MDINEMRVLSVDDNSSNLLMIEIFAKKMGLRIDSYESPLEALKAAAREPFDIVILDYMMPQMDGLQFIDLFRKENPNVPVIMVTAAGNETTLQLEALKKGATDFLTKPLNAAIFQARVNNLLRLRKAMLLVENRAELLTYEVEKATVQVREREFETLSTLGKISEYRDPETNQHLLRVASYSKLIGQKYGLNETVQDILYHAAPFHDIGKVGIPDRILLKVGKLDEEEWIIMKKHSLIGYDLLKSSKSHYLQAGSIIAFSHHERYDGGGYPKGLSGNIIPLFGRIVAIADVFDALCSQRPYKKKWSLEEAFQYIEEQREKHFDPQCVDCFLSSRDEIYRIYEKNKEKEDE